MGLAEDSLSSELVSFTTVNDGIITMAYRVITDDGGGVGFANLMSV